MGARPEILILVAKRFQFNDGSNCAWSLGISLKIASSRYLDRVGPRTVGDEAGRGLHAA